VLKREDSTVLKLKKIQFEAPEKTLATFDVCHTRYGADGRVLTLAESLVLESQRREGPVLAKLVIEDCVGNTADEALDTMAAWLERLASAIRNRGPAVPVLLSYPEPVHESEYETRDVEKTVIKAYDSGALDAEMLGMLLRSAAGACAAHCNRNDLPVAADGKNFMDVVLSVGDPDAYATIHLESDADEREELTVYRFKEFVRTQYAWN
jgi:hypothetical protein